MIVTRTFEIKTPNRSELIDITGQVERLLRSSNLVNGTATVFIPGNTVAVTTVSCEGGILGGVEDLFMSQFRQILGDQPATAQLKVALLGTSLTLPFNRGKLPLATWQKIVLANFGQEEQWHLITLQMLGE